MSNGIFRVLLVAVALSAFAASAVFGEEPNAPAEPKPPTVIVVGTVSVVKDANDVIIAVMLTTESEEVYDVVLDKVGLELGKMDGKNVEVQGVVTRKGDESWIKVLSYKEVEEPEA
jgi:hypothetical protein